MKLEQILSQCNRDDLCTYTPKENVMLLFMGDRETSTPDTIECITTVPGTAWQSACVVFDIAHVDDAKSRINNGPDTDYPVNAYVRHVFEEVEDPELTLEQEYIVQRMGFEDET